MVHPILPADSQKIHSSSLTFKIINIVNIVNIINILKILNIINILKILNIINIINIVNTIYIVNIINIPQYSELESNIDTICKEEPMTPPAQFPIFSLTDSNAIKSGSKIKNEILPTVSEISLSDAIMIKSETESEHEILPERSLSDAIKYETESENEILPVVSEISLSGPCRESTERDDKILPKRLLDKDYKILRHYFNTFIKPLDCKYFPKVPKPDLKLLCKQMGADHKLPANIRRIKRYLLGRFRHDRSSKNI